MKWYFWLIVWFGISGLLYLFILWVKKEAKKIAAENHKSQPMFKTRYLRK